MGAGERKLRVIAIWSLVCGSMALVLRVVLYILRDSVGVLSSHYGGGQTLAGGEADTDHGENSALEVAMLVLDVAVFSLWMLSAILFYRGIAKMSLCYLFPWFLMTVAVTGVFIYKLIRDCSNADLRFRDKPINIMWFVISLIATTVNAYAISAVLHYMRENNRRFMNKRVEQRPLPETNVEEAHAAPATNPASVFGPPVYMDPNYAIPSSDSTAFTEKQARSANTFLHYMLSPFGKNFQMDESTIYINSEPVESSLLTGGEQTSCSTPCYAYASVPVTQETTSMRDEEQLQSSVSKSDAKRRPVALPRCRQQAVTAAIPSAGTAASGGTQQLDEQNENLSINTSTESDSEETTDYIYDDVIPDLAQPQSEMTDRTPAAAFDRSKSQSVSQYDDITGTFTVQPDHCQNVEHVEIGSRLNPGHVSKMKALLFGT